MTARLLIALALAAMLTPSCTAPASVQRADAAASVAPERAGADRAASSPAPVTTSADPPRLSADGSVLATLSPGAVNATSINVSATYDAKVTLGFNTRYITVDSTATVTNTSGTPIDRLEFNTIATRLGGMRLALASVDGNRVSATVDDQTLVVPLGGVLADGGTVRVRISYSAHLRSDLTGSNWLFTRANGIVSAYRWLPWISRRVAFNRPNHGDPFITPVSPNVRVRITTDRTMVFATTGERIAISGLTQTFSAANVRDFTITASPYYRIARSTVGNVLISVYYRSGAPATAMMSAARNAISRMAALVGAYPYRTFKVAQSAGRYGMESPALVWVPTGVTTSNVRYLVTHETGHQWFYGLVGSDQANEPYTDEAVTDFLARYVLAMRRASRCSTARLDLSIYRYSSTCYYEVIYIQGGNFLDDLRKRMGSAAFWRGLRGYVAANRFGIAATRTLLQALDDATPLDLVPTYRPRFPRLYG